MAQLNLTRRQKALFLSMYQLGVKATYAFAKAGDQEGMLLELHGVENLVAEGLAVNENDDEAFKQVDLTKVHCWEV